MTREHAVLLRRGLVLEYVTLGWNVVGVAVVAFAARGAGPGALVGFGLDSLIEIGASGVVVWQLRGVGAERQRIGLRLIGFAFLALAAYVAGQSAWGIATGTRPGVTSLGLAWLALTVVAMLGLAAGKSMTGRQLGNPVLTTEARVTLVDAYLAACVLAGLALNAVLGWWWADPIAGLVIVFYGIREGRHALLESGPPESSTTVSTGIPLPADRG